MNAPKPRTVASGGYVFPMKRKDRDRLLNRMTPDARAWFYDREMTALRTLEEQIEAEKSGTINR